MNEILLLGKKILIDKSPILYNKKIDSLWEHDWCVKQGKWTVENGYLIGEEPRNMGGILLSRESFDCDIMLKFTVSTVLPATRDLNAVFCAKWDDSTNYLKEAYISGFNGWYDGKSGIERFPENGLNATTTLYNYTPGKEIKVITGAINGHCFLVANDKLIMELIDTKPYTCGHVGFSPYSTKLKIKDIEIRKINWEKREQQYIAEF